MTSIIAICLGIGLLYLVIRFLKYWFKPSEPRGHKGVLKANDEFVKKMRDLEKRSQDQQ